MNHNWGIYWYIQSLAHERWWALVRCNDWFMGIWAVLTHVGLLQSPLVLKRGIKVFETRPTTSAAEVFRRLHHKSINKINY